MQTLATTEIKKMFLAYFLANGHQLIPPHGVLPENDPTLMFINSGMAPMKSFFLGLATPPHVELTNIQDCIRTVDIDDVGDTYHGSSFRMMGSWSFGSYLKEKAIQLAFRLITEGYGLPKERLYATVLREDSAFPGVPADEESARVWDALIGSDHIVWRPPADNFWGPPGETGPCGPCTEVFFDRGAEFGDPNCTDILIPNRHIEIWNAGVFMMYFMDNQKKLAPLAIQCVDTGAGLERFAMILQNTASIHEICQFMPAFGYVLGLVSTLHKARIIFDHLKTSLLIMGSNIFPSNQREGYVLRRLLRRAFSNLYIAGASLEQVIPITSQILDVIDIDSGNNPRLAWNFIDTVLTKEVNIFGKVLKLAEKLLAPILASKELSAETAFQMKTTNGVPEELMIEICQEHKIMFPAEGLAQLMEEHRVVSRK